MSDQDTETLKAPGLMDRPSLNVELVEKHGWKMKDAKALSWPEAIDQTLIGRGMVCVDCGKPTSAMDIYRELICNHCSNAREMKKERTTVTATETAEVEPVEDTPKKAKKDKGKKAKKDKGKKAKKAETPVEDTPAMEKRGTVFVGIPGTNDFIFSGHMGAGPSGAERWMNCPGSLPLTKTFLETLALDQEALIAEASAAARQGTTAHIAGEARVNFELGRLTAKKRDKILVSLQTPEMEALGEDYDEEMEDFVGHYVEYVKQLSDAGHEILVESRVAAVVPLVGEREGEVYEIKGSADAIALPSKKDPVLTVIDLKYGDGLYVDPEDNPQVMIYALGALSLLADEDGVIPHLDRIECAIVQPRLGGIKTWSVSLDELLQWRDEILSPAVTSAIFDQPGELKFNPSEKACQFCLAQGSCAALVEARMEAATDLFDEVIEVDLQGGVFDSGSLSDARLGHLYEQGRHLVAIIEKMKEEAQRRLRRGESVPGFHLVNYQPPRGWKPEAKEILQDIEAVWKDPALVTPKTALATAKGDDELVSTLSELIVNPDIVPVIGALDDRRAKYEGRDVEKMFPDLP